MKIKTKKDFIIFSDLQFLMKRIVIERLIHSKNNINDLTGIIDNFLEKKIGPFSNQITKKVNPYYPDGIYIQLRLTIKPNSGIDLREYHLKRLLRDCEKYIKSVGKQ